MLASSSTTSTRGRAGAGGRPRRRRGVARARRAAARTLAVEPRVDVALAEPPLPADADGGNLAGLDQPVHRAQVDLEVLEDFFGREKRFVNHRHVRLARCVGEYRQLDGEDRRRRPGWLAAANCPPCSWTMP